MLEIVAERWVPLKYVGCLGIYGEGEGHGVVQGGRETLETDSWKLHLVFFFFP